MRVITGTARSKKLITPKGSDVRPTTDMVKEAVFSAVQFEIEGAAVLDLFAGSGQIGIEALSRGAKSAVFVDKNRDAIAAVKENLKTTEGAAVLDLFAGSGQIGIEALSRGAKSAVFVDKNRDAIAAVKENLKTTQLAEKAKVLLTDSLAFLKSTGEQFDFVFLDPPYEQGICQQALPLAVQAASETCVIFCETRKQEELPTGEQFDFVFLDPPYEQGICQQALPLAVQAASETCVIFCETRKQEELPEEVGDFRLKKTYRYGKIKLTQYRRKGE